MAKNVQWRRSTRVLVSGGLIAVVAAASIVLNTDFRVPPRYDGAGYAVLGRALATGEGYREIQGPTPIPHTHYPPGYPIVLAALWQVNGRSAEAAHVLSTACTLAAVLAAWVWFRSFYPERIALAAGFALALNWTWGRNGGAILSEPPYFLWGQLAILAGTWAGRRGGLGRGLLLGILLAATVLTRHVGAALAPAIGLDLLGRGRRASLLGAGLATTLLILPWIVWLAVSRRETQVDQLAAAPLVSTVLHQLIFYVQRLPDQWVGPIVEIGTVYKDSPALFVLVNAWSIMATALIALGWSRALRTPRRRLAGLIPLTTLPLLLIWPFTEAGRFLVPLVPCLIVGAIEGLTRLGVRFRWRRPRVWAAWAVVLATLPYSFYAIATGRAEAQRRGDRAFDAASAWIARSADRPGPVVTSHPAEVFWWTGRKALDPESSDPQEVARLIEFLGAAYVVIEGPERARPADDPSARFVRRYPGRVRRVWSRTSGGTSITIFEIQERRP